MSRPTWTINNRTPEDKIPQFPDTIVIGDFRINTTATGSLETKPVSAPANQEPADVIQPASIRLRENDITLEASASFGGSVVLKDLLNALLDLPIYSIAGVEDMPLRSVFSLLFTRVTGVESSVADISGVRLAAEEAKSALNDIKDAMQDVSGALLELATATAASDLAGVLGRVTALEAIPAVDLTTVNSRLDAAEGAITLKASQLDVDAALLNKANQAEFTAVADRVTALEGGNGTVGSRLDAVEAALPSKVAQADYDVYVASNDAAVAAAASAASAAQTAADAAATAVAGKEDKGRIHKIDMVTTDVSGVNAAYWMNSLDSTIGAIVTAGKIAEFIADGSNEISHFLSLADAAVAGDAYRFKNGSASADWRIVLGSQGGESVLVVPGETVTVVYAGSGVWKIL
jgi:hypothetical protein